MRFDARSKIILVVASSLTYGLRLGFLQTAYLVVGMSLLFLLSGKKKMAVVAQVGFLGLGGVSRLSVLPAWLSHLSFVLGYIWVPLLAGHFLLMTTSSYELVHALRKWHLPEALLLVLGVMSRFLPAIKQDARHIHAALMVRGIFLGKRDMFLRPHIYLECFVVPLMMSLLRTAQDLTLATLTKGLVLKGKPSEFVKSSWTWLDWSLCLWSLSFLLFLLK